MTSTAPVSTAKPKAPKAKAPKKAKAEKKGRAPKYALTAAQAKEILDRLQSGKSRLGQERVRAKLTSNTPLRKALQEHVSKKEYRATIVAGLAAIKAAKAPKAKAPKVKAPKKAKAAGTGAAATE